jgi:uncharacterized protein YcgL (UPF0745 family)
MARIALLIGVSEYGTDLSSLPCATKDATALQHLLQDKEIGKFDEVRMSLNPDTQTMSKEIEKLFKKREKEDFVLLFFSGHGIQDEFGRLFFAAQDTHKDNGEIYWTYTVPASAIQKHMEGSRCRQIVVILDCCFSGAFSSDLIPRNVRTVAVEEQLGGKGRAILTSCNAVQYAYEEKDANLSIYSQYLVEGLKTGEADRNQDGQITVDELHHYIREKIETAGFPMSPEIDLVMDRPLTIAHAPVKDKIKHYQNIVMLYAQQGSISSACRKILASRREKLALSATEARAIESTVLKSQKKYQQKLYAYRQEYLAIVRHSLKISEPDRRLLMQLQQGLDLNSQDVEQVEALAHQTVEKSRHWFNQLKWMAMIPIVPFAFTSAATVGIYFQVYEKLPLEIPEPLPSILDDSHEYLHETVHDLRRRLGIQIIGSDYVEIERQKAKSEMHFELAVGYVTQAANQAQTAKKRDEWESIARLWQQAKAEMGKVEPVSVHYQLAQQRITTYHANQQQAQKAASLKPALVNKSSCPNQSSQ